MAKFDIGDLSFKSKKEAHAAVRKVLDRYPLEGEVTEEEDGSLLYDLLQLHHGKEVKIGVGVEFFWVRDNGRGDREFWLTRADGTSTDWSFRECLYPRSPKTKALAGFRAAVVGQILEFKAKAFGNANSVPCAVSGALVSKNDAHVDHEIPFANLLEDFLSKKGVRLEDVEVEPDKDGDTVFVLLNKPLALQWAAYHLQHAKLRIVTKQVNLNLAKKQR